MSPPRQSGEVALHLEKAMRIVRHTNTADDYWTVHVDPGEYEVHGRKVSYAFCLGTIDPSGRVNVWTPVASVPRGYKQASLVTLQAVAKSLIGKEEK